MGAECIKIETLSRPTYHRTPPPPRDNPNQEVVRQGTLDELNVNKLSAVINLKDPDGRKLFKALVAVSDVVVENFQAGVMDRLGIGYKELRMVNPSIVMVAMSAHGATGPERAGKGFAQIFGAMGGASYLTGYDDGPPVELRLPSDLISGTAGCFALLAGVYHARNTGEGLFIDCASREVIMSVIGEELMDAIANQRHSNRIGNRSLGMAPHNVYRCSESDTWISIAVGNYEEWAALCNALNHAEWLTDQQFGDQYLRSRNQKKLDSLIEQWTLQHTASEAMEILQESGVPAAATYTSADLLADPHLQQRGCFLTVKDQAGNPYTMMRPPWKFGKTPAVISHRSPRIGENNDYVFSDLLGMTNAETSALVARKVIY